MDYEVEGVKPKGRSRKNSVKK